MKKTVMVLALFIVIWSPLAAQSSRDEALVDLYKYLLEPKSLLVDNLIGRNQELFFGADTAFSFTEQVPYDGIYALFAADRYNFEKINATGIWYTGFYARQSELITSQVPLAFTLGCTMRLPGRFITSWAFDWTWIGLSSDEEEDRNFLSVGLYGLRYGIGFRNLFEVEYHTWGVYDLDVLVGWLSAFLKWDTTTGSYYTDMVLKNIRISERLAFSIAALLQLVSEDEFSTDYWYLWPSLELTMADREPFTLNLLLAGGVVHRDEEYLWGFFAGFDLVSRTALNNFTKRDGSLPVWLRAGIGVNDREAWERLRGAGLVTMQVTIGILVDFPEKTPPPAEKKEPIWERIRLRNKDKEPEPDPDAAGAGNDGTESPEDPPPEPDQ
jgi:hypothetical protein